MSSPRLKLRFTRREGKRPLLVATRADGSRTMAEIAVGVEHDLTHYVVETTLRLHRAFYGLLAEGMEVADFDVAGATRKIDLPLEAVQAEFIVGLLQIERRNGEPCADFNAELRRALAAGRRPVEPPAPISAEQLQAIRTGLDALMARWNALAPGGSLELMFD